MNSPVRVGILDSGIGGLPAARRLIDRFPNVAFRYLGDTARGPYGMRSVETVRAFALQSLTHLLKMGLDCVIVSSHTVCACAGRVLVEAAGVPVIDILNPTVDRACRLTRKGRIGVLGSEALASSGAYESAIRRLRSTALVLTRPTPILEPMVIEGRLKKPESLLIVKKYLLPLRRRQIDTLIPACGTYAPLQPVLQRKAGKRVQVIDPVHGLLERMEKVLEGITRPGEDGLVESRPRFFVTDLPPWLEAAARRLFMGTLKLERAA
ncbi:MAG: glutamate racemase [Desulfobacterales bacterium]